MKWWFVTGASNINYTSNESCLVRKIIWDVFGKINRKCEMKTMLWWVFPPLSLVYRGFWTIFIILGAASSLSGGFLLVYGVPFASAVCYKVGGGFLMISGKLLHHLMDTKHNYKFMCKSTFSIKSCLEEKVKW